MSNENNSNFNRIMEHTVEGQIGKGGFCQVYKIKEISPGKEYAKKIFTDYESQKTYIKKEIEINKIVTNCKSPYTIKYICSNIKNANYYEEEEEKFMIFELASKGNLFDYIKSYEIGLNDQNCKVIIYKVLKGLETLHGKGICHRDLDPQNIFLDGERYQVQLGDYGLSDFFLDESGNRIVLKGEKGKPVYKAPEMMKWKEYDERVDIFSLGVTLFVLRTATYPFASAIPNYNGSIMSKLYSYIKNKKEENYWKQLTKIISKKCEIIFEPHFKDLFVKMVAYKPDERLTIEEILNHPYMVEVSHANEELFKIFEDNLIKELNYRNSLFKHN